MKYAIETVSEAIICIPNLIQNGEAIQKLIGGYTNTQTAWRSHKPTLIVFFFKI
jgi:hypothetical protein